MFKIEDYKYILLSPPLKVIQIDLSMIWPGDHILKKADIPEGMSRDGKNNYPMNEIAYLHIPKHPP